MSDPRHENRHRELTILRKHEESNTMLAIVMAGIAGLFIIGIVAAYNYASSASPDASQPASASATATRSPPETTGSGSNAPPQKAVPDKSMKQQ
jgi:hypothetical protein